MGSVNLLQQNINRIIHAFLHINTLARPARSTQSEHARALLALANLLPEAAILLVSDRDWALATLTGLGGEGDPSTKNKFSPYERGLFNFIAVLDAVAVLGS